MERDPIGQLDHLGQPLYQHDNCVHISRYSSSVRGRRCAVVGDEKNGVRVLWLDRPADGGRLTGVVAPYNLVRVGSFE
jgi:hypothetical protein